MIAQTGTKAFDMYDPVHAKHIDSNQYWRERPAAPKTP